jgi:hypothetical protein
VGLTVPRGGHNTKDPADRQGKDATRARLTLLEPKTPATPTLAPPGGLLKSSKDLWATFWASTIASAVVTSDHGALVRWIEAVDELARVNAVFRKTRLVKGSQDQPVLNPLHRHVVHLKDEIRKHEEVFGMAPLWRARLGLTTAQAALTVDQLLDDLDRSDDDHDSDALEGTYEAVQ